MHLVGVFQVEELGQIVDGQALVRRFAARRNFAAATERREEVTVLLSGVGVKGSADGTTHRMVAPRMSRKYV